MKEHFQAQIQDGASILTLMVRDDNGLSFQHIEVSKLDSLNGLIFESMWFGDDTVPVFKQP